jgi:hypothetical protein
LTVRKHMPSHSVSCCLAIPPRTESACHLPTQTKMIMSLAPQSTMIHSARSRNLLSKMSFPPALQSLPVLLYPAILYTSLRSVPILSPSPSNLTKIVMKFINTLLVILKCLRVSKNRSGWEYHCELTDLRPHLCYLVIVCDIVVTHRPCREHCMESRRFSLFSAVIFCDTVLQWISVPFLPALSCTGNYSDISLFNIVVICSVQCNVCTM